MSLGSTSYHGYTNYRPQSPQPFAPSRLGNNAFHPDFNPLHYHATQFHAAPPQPHTYGRPVTPPQPLNRYIPDATIKTVYDHKIVDQHVQLRPGEVVEVTRPGHQTELQYANYSGHLEPLTQSRLDHIPNELREQVARVGGPSYFAHDLHNKFATANFERQFNSNNFHGPNRSLI